VSHKVVPDSDLDGQKIWKSTKSLANHNQRTNSGYYNDLIVNKCGS
jgi:hypothetical protein